MKLVHLFDDNENLLAHFLCEESKFDKVFVLVAVADDQSVRVLHVRKNRMEFRLGTCFKTNVELGTVTHHFFQDRTLLVHLDREDAVMATLVAIFSRRLREALVNLFDAAVQNIRETQQHRSRNIAQGKFLHEFVKVNARTAVLDRRNRRVTLVVNVKVTYAPTLYVVKISGIVNAPFFHE